VTTIEQVHAICRGCHLCDAGSEPVRGLLPLTLVFRCPTCRRFVPWCFGAADDRPDDCDACWGAAHSNHDAAPAAREA
jgi:hypothetical protein